MTQASITTPYRALAVPCQWTLEEKRSLFHTYLFPVQTREQALAHVEQLRTSQPGASHYCWAYLIGPADQPRGQAYNDDGEPSGTAGKPMLHVLTQRGAGDCLAVVVRIFGGIKLGTGGLVRAYGGAVSQALDRAQWRDITPVSEVTIRVPFADEERVRHCLEPLEASILSVTYAKEVHLHIAVPSGALDALKERVQHLTRGRFEWERKTS